VIGTNNTNSTINVIGTNKSNSSLSVIGTNNTNGNISVLGGSCACEEGFRVEGGGFGVIFERVIVEAAKEEEKEK